MLPLLLACAEPLPPDCDTDTDTACFTGVFGTLLGGQADGVVICAPEVEGVECVTSDDDGAWKLPGLPLDTDVLVTTSHDDYVPVVYPQNTAMDWVSWHKKAVPTWTMESNAERLGVTLQEDRGHLLFIVWEGLNTGTGEDAPLVEDVTAELSGEVAPFYANNLGLADDEATATGRLGQGGAINLEEGTHTLYLTAPEGPCTGHSFTWNIAEDGGIPVPIRAGFTTAVEVICPVP